MNDRRIDLPFIQHGLSTASTTGMPLALAVQAPPAAVSRSAQERNHASAAFMERVTSRGAPHCTATPHGSLPTAMSATFSRFFVSITDTIPARPQAT